MPDYKHHVIISPSNSAQEAAAAYTSAISLIQKHDMFGWRKLSQKLTAQFQAEIIEWQNARRKQLPTKVEQLPQMMIEGLSCCAPLMSLALAGVESRQPPFSNQLGLVEDFLHISGWERSGNTILTQFPEAIVFVYQALLGALLMQTEQKELAIRLANTEFPNANSNKDEPLFQHPRLIGWPESLNHRCTTAWVFLLQMPDHWPWLHSVFGDEDSYKASLCAHYMFLSTLEFLYAIDYVDFADDTKIRLTVPITYVAVGEAIQRKALRYFKAAVPEIAILWRAKKMTPDSMDYRWKQWLKISERWVSEVYRDSWNLRYTGLPIRDLPDLIAKSGV